jgi:hypothetical protein
MTIQCSNGKQTAQTEKEDFEKEFPEDRVTKERFRRLCPLQSAESLYFLHHLPMNKNDPSKKQIKREGSETESFKQDYKPGQLDDDMGENAGNMNASEDSARETQAQDQRERATT